MSEPMLRIPCNHAAGGQAETEILMLGGAFLKSNLLRSKASGYGVCSGGGSNIPPLFGEPPLNQFDEGPRLQICVFRFLGPSLPRGFFGATSGHGTDVGGTYLADVYPDAAAGDESVPGGPLPTQALDGHCYRGGGAFYYVPPGVFVDPRELFSPRFLQCGFVGQLVPSNRGPLMDRRGLCFVEGVCPEHG